MTSPLIEAAIEKAGITRVARLTGLDRIGVPVWTAIRPNSRSLATSQGKSFDDSLARVCAIMESLEAYHCENLAERLETFDSTRVGDQFDIIDFNALPIKRDFPFDAATNVACVQASCMLGGKKPILVPIQAIELDYDTYDHLSNPFRMYSAGLAGHLTLEKAQKHALLEVIEDDQISFFSVWSSKTPSLLAEKILMNETIDDLEVQGVIERCKRLGIHFLFLDLRMQFSIPTFACVVIENGNVYGHSARASGFGCHPNSAKALRAAVLEAIQSRLTFIAGSRDDLFKPRYEMARVPKIEGFLGCGEVDFQDVPNCEDSLDAILGHISQVLPHSRIASVDLTDPQIGLPFVKIFIESAELGIFEGDYRYGDRLVASL